jgi:hypothetical protein
MIHKFFSVPQLTGGFQLPKHILQLFLGLFDLSPISPNLFPTAGIKSGISGEPSNQIFCEYNRKRAGIRYPHIANELLARHVPDWKL